MKKIIVISTSLRNGSNSDQLADKFIQGAMESGNIVEKISLINKEIAFCKGCMACQKIGKCVIKDDVNAIMQKVLEADVICWATPIYYYEMSGQMKTLLDRMNPMYPMDYAFRDIYMIATAAEEEESAFEKAYNGLQGWVDCFEKAKLKGLVTGGGIGDANDAPNHEETMKRAYELGKAL